jgi:hypothetical protein
MPKILTVGTDEFEFPLEGENAGYGSEITDWAEAVTESLSAVFRPGDITSRTAQIQNNITVPTSIQGFIFSSTIVSSFEAKYFIERPSSSKRESGYIEGYHDGSDWIITIRVVGSADAGVSLNINSSGQITYTSTPLDGVGTIKFEAKVINK